MPVATIQRRSSEYFEHIDSDISARLARAARPGGTVNQAGDRQFVNSAELELKPFRVGKSREWYAARTI